MGFLAQLNDPVWVFVGALMIVFGHSGWIWFTLRVDQKTLREVVGKLEGVIREVEAIMKQSQITDGRHEERIAALERRVDRIEG